MDAQAAAIEIVRALVSEGHIAYFAGGWVRDYLMNHPSCDIDIATDASPEKIRELFPQTIPVGMSYGVVIVVMEGRPFEVATFRRDVNYKDGRRPEKIAAATPQEDAYRRDFTINGMFYDPLKETVYDFINGQQDLKDGIIRTIGDPRERFFEDRLRMIRAIRFAARFDFAIDSETKKAIQEKATTIFPAVTVERIWQEFQKMVEYPRTDQAFVEMHRLGLLSTIFPTLKEVSVKEIEKRVATFSYFPESSPPILYLMELFPEASLKERLGICEFLKVSNREAKVVELKSNMEDLVHKEEQRQEVENIDWIRCYAHSEGHLCLKAIAARYSEKKRKTFLKTHRERHQEWLPHIIRFQKRDPVVKAAHLQECGIKPGKQMGQLLKEAERLAAHHNSEDPNMIVELLKKSPFWPSRL